MKGEISAEDIRWIRRGLKIRQKDLAKQLGVNVSTVGHWERGQQIPKRENLKKLLRLRKKVLGKSAGEASTLQRRMKMTVGEQLREARELLGYFSQISAADVAGIDRSQFSRVESGTTDPRLGTLRKLSQAFGYAFVVGDET